MDRLPAIFAGVYLRLLMKFTTLELCAGGGGQALGLEQAGFEHLAAVEYEEPYCRTLRLNRPKWNVLGQDIRDLSGTEYSGVDLLAGGVPCPPFSVAGKQLGGNDERDMFPAALEIIRKAEPRAVMLENVQGLASAKFSNFKTPSQFFFSISARLQRFHIKMAQRFSSDFMRIKAHVVAEMKEIG